MLRLPSCVLRNKRSIILNYRQPFLKYTLNVNLPLQVRFLSVGDVFGKVDLNNVADLPPLPSIPAPKPSIESLVESGQSVLSELGLFTWYQPTGYLRYILEAIHLNLDIPWWGSLVIMTISLRLLMFKVVLMSQRLVAVQNQYKPELAQFKDRIREAQCEGNHMLVQQIMVEQNDFLKSKNIKLGRQLLVLLANGGVFMTQFFAVKKMISVNYPGFSTGGILWFTDLTASDPYFLLPMLSSATMFFVIKLGVDSGASSDQMSPLMRYGMQYGVPLAILISSSQFSSAICLYWFSSNLMSLSYGGLFRMQKVRNAFGLPKLIEHPKTETSAVSLWKEYKKRKAAPPSLDSFRKNDLAQFKKAGRGKPVNKI